MDRLFRQEHRRVADVRRGEALKASKRETHPKIRPPHQAAGRLPASRTARPSVATRVRSRSDGQLPCAFSLTRGCLVDCDVCVDGLGGKQASSKEPNQTVGLFALRRGVARRDVHGVPRGMEART